MYDVTIVTVSIWISHLAELGFVKVQLIKSNKNEIVERRIYIADTPSIQNIKNLQVKITKIIVHYSDIGIISS